MNGYGFGPRTAPAQSPPDPTPSRGGEESPHRVWTPAPLAAVASSRPAVEWAWRLTGESTSCPSPTSRSGGTQAALTVLVLEDQRPSRVPLNLPLNLPAATQTTASPAQLEISCPRLLEAFRVVHAAAPPSSRSSTTQSPDSILNEFHCHLI